MHIKIILLLLLSSFYSIGQEKADFGTLPSNNPMKTALDSVVHASAADFFSKTDVPGVVLSVYQNGNVHFYTYGFADKKNQQPFTDSTLLEIGSITKTFTAEIILILQEKGMLNIDQPLAAFFPEATAENPSLQQISLRQILNHTAGLPRLPANLAKVKNYSYLQPYEHYSKDNLVDCLKKLKPDTIGKYDYSNMGFGILGTIAEMKTGKSLNELMKEYIFTPLDMRQSSLSDSSELPRATGYMTGKPAPYWKFESLAGAGAIKSTASDMTRYLVACLGKSSNTDFNSAIELATKTSLQISNSLSIGMAWHVMTSRTPNIFWHNGGTYGFSTFIAFEPTSQTAIFAATNSFNANKPLETLSGRIMINITKNK